MVDDRWNVPRDGVDMSAGEVNPEVDGVGVLEWERKSAGAAMVGDCRGDWMPDLSCISIIRGGSNGVDERISGSGNSLAASSSSYE